MLRNIIVRALTQLQDSSLVDISPRLVYGTRVVFYSRIPRLAALDVN